MKNHQIDKIHKSIHKIDKAEQIVKALSNKIFTLDQAQIEMITQILLETFHIKALEIDTVPMTVQETRQTIEVEITQLIDHKTILTKDHIKMTIKKRSRCNSRNQNNNYQSKSRKCYQYANKQDQNYRSKTPKHQRQFDHVQSTDEASADPPGFENTEISEQKLNHTHCESTDHQCDTGNTIITNMPKIEHEYKYQLNQNITKVIPQVANKN